MNRELLARATVKAIDVQLEALRAVTARMLASLGRTEVILYDLIDDDPFLELLPAPRAPAIAAPAPLPFWRAVARAGAMRRAGASG